MEAIVLSQNRHLEHQEVSLSPLATDECTIAIRAVGVCSSDIPRAFEGGAYHYPLIPGHEISGEVVACGEDAASKHPVGSRVCVFPLLPCFNCTSCAQKLYAQCERYDYYGSRRNGGFAEYMNVKAWNLLSLPGDVSFDDGAMLEPVSVVFHALRRLLPRSATGNIAILGGGFLGLITMKILARTHPACRPVIIDRNPYKLSIAERAGADPICLDDEASWRDYATEREGHFPYVLEAAGIPNTLRYSLMLAARGGRVCWMGNAADDVLLGKALISSMLRKEISVLGTWNSSYRASEQSDWDLALGLLQDGADPASLVSHKVSLADLPEIMTRMAAHRERRERHEILKVLVHPNTVVSV